MIANSTSQMVLSSKAFFKKVLCLFLNEIFLFVIFSIKPIFLVMAKNEKEGGKCVCLDMEDQMTLLLLLNVSLPKINSYL